MNRGRDYEGGGGGSRYGGNKRSYDDDNSHYGGNDGYKRSRHEGGGYQRPYNNNGGDSYRNGGGRDDRRYGGGYNNNSNYDRRRDNGPAPESEQARAWRLTKKGIVELGENSATPGTFDDVHGHTLRDQLVDVAGKIKKELDGDRNDVKSSMITALVVRCVGRLSHKTSLYAVLVGLVNEKQSAFGRSVVDAVVKALQQDLDFFSTGETTGNEEDELRKSNNVEGVAQRTRLFVRFLGELVSTRVVKGEDMLSVLDTLQGLCTPDDFNSDSDDRSTSLRERENGAAFKDFFASVVLDTLLQVGVALSVNNEDIYDSLLSRCKEYISNREEESNPRGINDPSVQSANWLERRLRLDLLWEPESDGDDLVAACKKCDLLTQQWEALNLIRAEANTMADGDVNPHLRWKLPGVVYPQELFEKNFIEVQPHALTTAISVDFNSLDHSKIPRYEAVFRIFGEDSGAIGAPLTNLHLASYLTVRGHLGDVIEAFYPKPAAAAKHLLGVTRSYNVRFAQADIANLKTEYVLLESLLVKALNEKHVARLGYLCSVLTHLVKVDARLMSPAFAIVVELLFREIPLMNAGAVDAFVKLFSHFLSNFEYKWMWARWAHVLEASEDDAQRLFVSSVIERCVRLSYLQHMQTALPAEFHGLLPPAPKPRVIYQAEDESTVSTTSKEFFQAVSAKLKSHPPANALNAWLEEELNSGANIDRQLAIDIVFTAILDAGAATFTHSRLMLEKYGAIGDLFRGEQAELQLVKTVGFVWVNSPQHIGLILNMMLRQRIVLASTIAKWIFTTDAVQQYSWPYVWGILDETLTFLVVEIDTAKRAVLARTSGGDADMNDGNDSVSRLEEELQDLLKLVFGGFNRVITEYKANCESDGVSYKDNWFLSALAQLKAVGAKYRVVIESISESIIDEVFSGGRVDPDAKKVFEFVRDSYSNH